MTGQPINPLDILIHLDWAEGDDLEFKSARGGLPKSLWETYSAMANSHGGVILLGVEDDGRVSGVDEPRKLKKAFWDTVNNRGKVNLNLCSDADLFRKGETEVHEAIREALVNALIHADYNGQGGVVVEKFRDAFEFSNPGTLLVSFDQLLRGNVSECRNKSLQTMFMLIGAAEKAGSGVDRMRQGWASQHWRSPIVREQVQPDRVTWRLPMISLIPQESLTRLEELFGNNFNQFNKNEVQALVTADIEGAVDNTRMRQICAIHAADVTRLLQGLVAKRALVQEGQGRWSRYRLPEVDDSEHRAGDSVHKDGDSVHKDGDSVHSDDTLSIIAAPARSQKRLRPDEMEQIILRLCQDRWLARNQLADLLNRHPDGLRSRFLTPMVSHGRLRLRYPDKPNRVDQAYTADGLVKEKADSLTKTSDE